MKKIKCEADYSKFRLNKLNTPEFSHLRLLLFWPVYGIVFFILERLLSPDYHIVFSVFDNYIPFCELFIIPYLFWFVYLIGMLLYTMLFSIDTFKKYMRYIIITYSITLAIYIVYPTAQELRPDEFPRSNIFIRAVSQIYSLDTNTNVCPSLHVIGSLAVFFAAWNDKRLCTPPMRFTFAMLTILISISTVYLKQHSVIDVLFGGILSILCYPLAFGRVIKLHENQIKRNLKSSTS